MKPNDFIKHDRIKAVPKLQVDTDRLKAMFDACDHSIAHSVASIQCLQPLQGPGEMKTVEVPFGFMLHPVPGPFQGVALCRHCIALAVVHLRDTANSLEDLVMEANKHAVPL